MKPIKPRQIAAMAAILLILLLVLATLLFACLNTSWSNAAFRACLYAVIVVPIMAYVFLHFAKVLRKYASDEEEDATTPDADK